MRCGWWSIRFQPASPVTDCSFRTMVFSQPTLMMFALLIHRKTLFVQSTVPWSLRGHQCGVHTQCCRILLLLGLIWGSSETGVFVASGDARVIFIRFGSFYTVDPRAAQLHYSIIYKSLQCHNARGQFSQVDLQVTLSQLNTRFVVQE